MKVRAIFTLQIAVLVSIVVGGVWVVKEVTEEIGDKGLKSILVDIWEGGSNEDH